MEELVIKDNYVSKSTLKSFLALCVLFLAFIFGLQILEKDSKKGLLFSDVQASIQTWVEQSFKDKFWGNGFFQTRTLYTAKDGSRNTTRSYCNKKLLVSLTNGSSIAQNYSYTKTDRVGHEVGPTIKAKAARIEACVGYKFNYETVTTTTIGVVVPSGKTMDVYISDIRVSKQTVDVIAQKQVASFRGWKNKDEPTNITETIVEYSGSHVLYAEY